MSIAFLPKDYQEPKAPGSYMKFQKGENKFRILSSPVLGWEEWADKKPIRYRMDEKPSKPLDPKIPPKHFWAFIVWNYQEEKIQILNITQASIRKSLEALCNDADWGAPYFYDIKVGKTGEKKETEYSVNPVPHKPLAENIKAAFKDKPCNLEALFTGEEPFRDDWKVTTPGVFSLDDQIQADGNDGKELLEMLGRCSLEYQETINKFCLSNKLNPDLSRLPSHLYDKLEKSIRKELDAADPFAVGQ